MNHNFYLMVNSTVTEEKTEYNYILTRQCGEAVLENWGSCCLGSLNLPNFITGSVNTNWQKLEKTIKHAIRFLDNVIDVNKYVLKEIDIAGHNSRRVGLGVMGLADYSNIAIGIVEMFKKEGIPVVGVTFGATEPITKKNYKNAMVDQFVFELDSGRVQYPICAQPGKRRLSRH